MAKDHFSGRGNRNKYELDFDNVFEIIEHNLDGQGKRIKIRDQQDLRTLIERLNEKDKRKTKEGKGRMTKQFIDSILNTRAAQKIIGGNAGRFGGTTSTLKRPITQAETAKIQTFKNEGKQIYTYEGGFATKASYRSKKGKLLIKFRSIKTGRFVKSSLIQE